MSEHGERQALILEPLDVLLFRDGRPLLAGWQVESALPLPQTLHGAIRTWLMRKAGCDFERLGNEVRSGKSLAEAAASGQPEAVAATLAIEVRGPWLARKEQTSGQATEAWLPLVPMPANLLKTADGDEDRFHKIEPLGSKDLPGWSPLLPGMRPLWHYATRPTERASGFLSWEGLRIYLQGGTPQSKVEHVAQARDLYDFDARTGIGVGAASRGVEEGAIYGAGYLTLRQGVGFYAEVVDTSGVLTSLRVREGDQDIVRFGGDSKRSRLTILPPLTWPAAEPADGQGTVILLTTPCPIQPASGLGQETGLVWLPESLRQDLVAAAVPGHRSFSGWDLARRGPKPTRFAVDAGAVYFMRPGHDASTVASLCSAEDSAAGWGHFVKGVWNYV